METVHDIAREQEVLLQNRLHSMLLICDSKNPEILPRLLP